MKPSTRIILNTLATYSHSLFAMVVSLFSARWVLLALGQSDFGLYGVVGSIVLLIAFLNGGMSVGVARFYAFSIGRGHNLPEEQAIDDLKRWFNTAFSIHLVLPFLIILIGWPIGEYAIQHWLTIPPERIFSCIWVFRISLLTAFVSVFSVPFTAMYSAHQLISELAVFGIISSCCNFIGAYYLLKVQSDRLIVYALYAMTISAGIPILQIIRAMFKFKACRIRLSYMYDKRYLKELFGFVGWKMFGMSCVVLRGQGTPVLINLYFGPLLNAAYSIAYRLSTQATSLSGAMQGAFQPALVSAEGKGDRQQMLSMAIQVCKFGTLLILFFVIPLTLEMESLLNLWLKTPPKYAGGLCQWMMAMLVVDKMTSGPMLAVNAFGKIAVYEIIQGSMFLLALPLMWLFLKLDMGPVSIGTALFISTAIYCAGRLLFSKHLLQFPVGRWIQQVAVPVLTLVAGSAAAGWGVMQVVDAGFLRLCLTTGITGVVTLVIGWLWLLNRAERSFIVEMIKKTATRLSLSKKPAAKLPPA
jgi:O-antigen/teichoic acid export membrane protein